MTLLRTACFCAVLAIGSTGFAGELRQADGRQIWQSERNFRIVQAGWDHLQSGDTSAALAEFETVLKRTRNKFERSQALFGIAQVDLMARDTDAAIARYEEVIGLNHLGNKPHFETMLVLAELHLWRDRPEQSEQWLNRWRSENPSAGEDDQQRADRIRAALDAGTTAALEPAPSELMPLVRVAPQYPRKAAINRLEGEVILTATVTHDGRVIEPGVVQSDPPGVFDEAALAAIAKWRFAEQEAPVEITQTFAFNLSD